MYEISDLPVLGGAIYSPELFSDPNKTVESDDTTLCDNISDTLIANAHLDILLKFTNQNV
jgi:hypothetical protein